MHKSKIALSVLTLASLATGCNSEDQPSADGTTMGRPCRIEENDDGTVTIECPDGSTATVDPGGDGEDGRDGKDGDNGKSGKTGAEGKDGPEGEPGTDGQNGAIGQNGDNGQDGTTGQNGDNGQDGTTGQNGDNGQDGAQGETGSPGTPGENGQDGQPGQPGETGASCSVECVDEQTVRMFCEDDSEISYHVESCKTPPVNLLSARGNHACWILPLDRRPVCWGSDSDEQLGNGVIHTDQARANIVDTRKLAYGLDTRWRSISTGSSTTCGITVAGEAYCWGSLLTLGNGGIASDAPTPVDISGLPPGTTWSLISPGNATSGSTTNFSCGVTAVGAAHCWGSDSGGRLGNGPGVTANQTSPSPVDISALSPETTWTTISVGNGYACGLTAEGAAYCWGNGQVSPAPVDVTDLSPGTTWTTISVGFDHTCALTAKGEAYCWGSDANGQLGNGALAAASSPSPVDRTSLPVGLTFTQVTAGQQHSCGLASDGSAWCWGNRGSGRLGDGGSVGIAQGPVAVDLRLLGTDITWKSLSAGTESSCGLTTEDEVYCWGNNNHGQLGTGALISLPQLRPGPRVPASIGVLVDHSEYKGAFSGAVGVGNPELPLTILALNGSTEQLTVTATSGNASIIPSANITVTGSGTDRLLSFEPIASGLVMLTVATASNQGEYSFRFEYGASATPPELTGVYYHHTSDASTALDVGGGYMLLGDDEVNTLFLYKQDVSGLPVKVWDFTSPEQLRSNELDIEAAARSNDTIVWTTSHANGSSGDAEGRRRVIFATKVSGSGADVELALTGRYGGGPGGKTEVAELGLWGDLIAWDKASGHGMGADALGFDAATQPGVLPTAPSGFNIEGLEFGADGTTGYLGFRAPTINVSGRQHALIVPVTNILELVDGIGEQTGRGQFGAPILLDLAGRSIREIRKNGSGEYLISAGPPDNATPDVNDKWALYTWAGVGQPAVFNRELPDVNLLTGGSWESIAVMPNPLQSGGSVRLMTDSGDTIFYGTDPTKSLEVGLRKSYSQVFTLE